jgi:hypothetical protein
MYISAYKEAQTIKRGFIFIKKRDFVGRATGISARI